MRLSVNLLVFPLVMALGGCASPEQLHPVPIAGGKLLGIGPNSGKANGYEIQQSAITPGTQERQVFYEFALSLPPDTTLKRVRVDDISDEQASLLIDDRKPWQEDRRWHARTSTLDAADHRLLWIFTVTPSMRVYRFIVSDATDRETILYQVVPYPDWIKSAIRRRWGEKY